MVNAFPISESSPSDICNSPESPRNPVNGFSRKGETIMTPSPRRILGHRVSP
jgi:hypothetical protein